MLVSTDNKRTHKCDSAGRYIVQGCDIHIAAGALIENCHVNNSSVGAKTTIANSTILDSRIGPANSIKTASITLVHSERDAQIDGPTEVSEAWLGRKTHIHQKGYFEGVFSNDFPILAFDQENGKLIVKEVLDLPHVSEYGSHTINSTNSGRLLPQPDSVMRDFGGQVELWHDPLLSHEPMKIGPCCWVCPWTKVIGGSSQTYNTEIEAIQDRLHTYLMPFSVAGYGGESTIGFVLPGEMSNGYGHKLRVGGWSFTYAPGAVIAMVGRLYEALDEDEKDKADIVVAASLENAICMLRYRAYELGLDLAKPRDKQRGSQAKWFWDYEQLIEAHIKAGIWKFKNGKPLGWVQNNNKWQHEKLDQIRNLDCASGGEFDITENDLLADAEQNNTRHKDIANAMKAQALSETSMMKGTVDSAADIHPDAIIDPSACIGPDVKVCEKAHIGPGTILKGNSVVGANTQLFRTVIENASVGSDTCLLRCQVAGTTEQPSLIGSNVKLTGCKVTTSEIGDHCSGIDASILNSALAADSSLSMFADLENVRAISPTIIGNVMKDCVINTTLMSMHSASYVNGLVAQPVLVQAGDKDITIEAIPMLGGGCQIQGKGTGKDAVTVEGAFIGSNAIVEQGCFIGLGSFVLGRLGSGEGLLPFTVSHKQGPDADMIGAVLTRFSNILVTHIVNWTYQALPKEQAGDIVHLITGGIRQGIDAIKSELDRRQKELPRDETGPFAKYKSLPNYTDQQLKDGLRAYEESLEQGNWNLLFDGKNLSFANEKGKWVERDGYIRWQKDTVA